MAWALRRQPDDVTAAKGLFRWSILYLFGLCLLLLLARLPLAASFGSQSAELIQQWIGPLALVTF
jgi:protoheme IX farnesyltransferase